MTNSFQSPVNLAFRLESLITALDKLEAHSQPESENEVRRLLALLRASSEFRGMDSLLAAAHIAELAPAMTLPIRVRELTAEFQKTIASAPVNTGLVLIVSTDKAYTSRLSSEFSLLKLNTSTVESISKAKDAFSGSPVAFCIIDLVLADLDGRALITDMRAHPETAAIPIIAISPQFGDSHSSKTLSVTGADAVFPKDASLDDIASFLTQRLKRSHIKGLQARRDQITGLPNRAACHEIFPLAQRSIQANDPMAFILVGIHQFKVIAARCPPTACDDIIRKIGSGLSSALRATDVVTRWDTSEFAILLTGEDHFGATKAMEKIFPGLAGLTIKSNEGELLPITICAGITINTSSTPIEDASLRAESQLYIAFRNADSPSDRKLIVSDAVPVTHLEEPVAICLSNPAMAKAVKQILERETFRSEIFTGIENIAERITSKPYSLLILDDEFPHESGFKLLQRLKQGTTKSALGVMMMVSRGDSIEKALKHGADDYFLKPPSMPAFLSQIRRIISQKGSSQSNQSLNIMVIDHELPQLLLAGTTLHQLATGQILLAKGAADALNRLKSFHPDYLIIDAHLPQITAQDFLNQILNMDGLKHTQIILAAQNPSELRQQNIQGLAGIISRPYRPETLLEELHAIIPSLPKSLKGRTPADPRLLELEIQRILALKA